MNSRLVTLIVLCFPFLAVSFQQLPFCSRANAGKIKESTSLLNAQKPQRLRENVDGVLYINDRCINCAACSMFAPNTFQRQQQDNYHVVYQQPDLNSAQDLNHARQAMAACPVAAIRVESLAERSHRSASVQQKEAILNEWTNDDQALVQYMSLRSTDQNGRERPRPFPRLFLDHVPDVYWVGHHNEASFGAIPYLLKARVNNVDQWIMVDTPQFTPSAVEAVTRVTGPTGPDYLFLTHVDDTAHHGLWKERFPSLQRIFHSGDLGRYNWVGDKSLEQVEIVLPAVVNPPSQHQLHAYSLQGDTLDFEAWNKQSDKDDVVILHTPGHSPGSITLYRRPFMDQPGIIFTGDTYAYTTRDGGHMTGFPRYGRSLSTQAVSLRKLVALDWSIVAPGHGHPREYQDDNTPNRLREEELEVALEELTTSGRRR